MSFEIEVRPLPVQDGGGFLASVLDLPGCMSDGETREEAVSNARDATAAWIDAARTLGHSVPTPPML